VSRLTEVATGVLVRAIALPPGRVAGRS
jgi:hypothetical protein